MSTSWENPTAAYVVTYRAAKSFRYNGRPVMKGEVLERDDPLVAAVNRKNRAGYFDRPEPAAPWRIPLRSGGGRLRG